MGPHVLNIKKMDTYEKINNKESSKLFLETVECTAGTILAWVSAPDSPLVKFERVPAEAVAAVAGKVPLGIRHDDSCCQPKHRRVQARPGLQLCQYDTYQEP